MSSDSKWDWLKRSASSSPSPTANQTAPSAKARLEHVVRDDRSDQQVRDVIEQQIQERNASTPDGKGTIAIRLAKALREKHTTMDVTREELRWIILQSNSSSVFEPKQLKFNNGKGWKYCGIELLVVDPRHDRLVQEGLAAQLATHPLLTGEYIRTYHENGQINVVKAAGDVLSTPEKVALVSSIVYVAMEKCISLKHASSACYAPMREVHLGSLRLFTLGRAAELSECRRSHLNQIEF